MSTVSDIKTQIKDLVGVLSSDTTVAARLLRWINNARRVLYRERDWDALKAYYQLNKIPDYLTGTVSITQDTRVVTGVGTTFTADMVGRYINFAYDTSAQTEWYRIVKFNSTTEIIIEADFAGATQSDISFAIRQIFYRVPAAARKLKNVSSFTTPRVISEIGDRNFLKNQAEYHVTTGAAGSYQLAGTWDKSTTYTTGTVTAAINSTVLVGSGTVWMDEAIPGDIITIASQDYVIKTVDSDTQVTLYAGLTAAASAASYSLATNPDSWVIRFSSQATGREIVPIEYYQHAFDLLVDSDSDFFIRRHPEMIVEGAAIWEKRSQEDASWAVDYQKWVAQIRGSFGETSLDAIFSPDFNEPQYE